MTFLFFFLPFILILIQKENNVISGGKYFGNWTQLLWWYKGTHEYPGRWDHGQVQVF